MQREALRNRLGRLFGWTLCLVASSVLMATAACLIDLYAFEIGSLCHLLGVSGLAMIAFGLAATCVAVRKGLMLALGQSRPLGLLSRLVLLIGLLAAAWAGDWMLNERPVTERFRGAPLGAGKISMPPVVERDFANFSLVRGVTDPERRHALESMYARIWVTNPTIHARDPIGATIDRYAARYSLDPVLLFHLAYVHSFWGEATSGPVPFADAMTAETIRDLTQIHLPGWFIESPLRRLLITKPWLQAVAGAEFGLKLRYAIHKATLDVSAQPYELNMLSDVLLVMQQYPSEFADIVSEDPKDDLHANLRDAYVTIRGNTLRTPYERPYLITPLKTDYYREKRDSVKRFVRAAYYATVNDFDLATRMAALLIVYQREYYRSRLGEVVWNTLPEYQQDAMLMMTRDVLTTSIGRPAYNVYALPEMNCTPVEFVASRAIGDNLDSKPITAVWRPKDYELLWGGADTKLAVFSEVRWAARGAPLPGIQPKSTWRESLRVVLRHN